MLWEQRELEILLDLWAPCLIHLNIIYHNRGARVQGVQQWQHISSVICSIQLCRIYSKINYCRLLSFNTLRKWNHSHFNWCLYWEFCSRAKHQSITDYFFQDLFCTLVYDNDRSVEYHAYVYHYSWQIETEVYLTRHDILYTSGNQQGIYRYFHNSKTSVDETKAPMVT